MVKYTLSLLGLTALSACAAIQKPYSGDLVPIQRLLREICRDFTVTRERFYCQQTDSAGIEWFDSPQGKAVWFPPQERITSQYWDNIENMDCDGKALYIGSDECQENSCSIVANNNQQCRELEAGLSTSVFTGGVAIV